MNTILQKIKASSPADKVAATTIAGGSCWLIVICAGVINIQIEILRSEFGWYSILSLVLSSLIVLLFGIPGFFAIRRGVLLLRAKSIENIKKASAAIAFFVAIPIEASLFYALPESIQEDGNIGFIVTTFAATLLAFVFYTHLCKYLVRDIGGEPGRFMDYVGQGIVAIITFELFLFIPTNFGDTRPHDYDLGSIQRWWPLLRLLIPYAFYKVAMRKIDARDELADDSHEQTA